MRYSSEFRRAWTGASGVAMDVGKKLLGYLANQKRLSGVDSLVQRIELRDADGNVTEIVEARWDMNQPTVRVYAAGGGESCEMYVESGLLDLGPNIASDAAERFNRGLPEFDDSPATLYFGDGVTCVDGEPGFNGAISVEDGVMNTDCLPSAGSPVASRLTDPVKKQAQALLPASCWSGLMQRYVQAVYGGDLLEYSATPTALTIETAIITVESSVGLVEIGGVLHFIVITDGDVSYRAVVPKSQCVESVLRAWSAMPAGSDLERSRKNKVLTIALSGCVVGNVVATTTIPATGNGYFPSRSIWVFAHDTPTAVAVLEDGGTATAYEATFSMTAGIAMVSLATLASGDVLNKGDWPLLAADKSPYGEPVAPVSGFAESADALQVGDSYEFPVYATYEEGVPRVVYCTVIASTLAITDMSLCFDLDNPYGPVIIGSDDSRTCRTDIDAAVQVAYGFHATGWTTVSLNTCFLDTSDDTTVVRSRAAGFQGVAIDPTMQHESYTAAADLTNRVPPFALSGPNYSTGLGDCAVNNLTAGSATVVTDNYPADSPCNYYYIYDDVGNPVSTDLELPYFDAVGAVFYGQAKASGLHVPSLAWGASNCIVVDRYVFDGGQGAYLSFTGTAYLMTNGIGAIHDLAVLTSTLVQYTYTYAVPGDCGSLAVLTNTEDFVVEQTSTLPTAEGDLVYGMMGFASPQWAGSHLSVNYTIVGSIPSSTVEIAYPDPRYRGVETMTCSVFMGAATDEQTDQNDVSLYTPDSAYEHPSGLGTYVANNDVRGDCDAFDYLGLQVLTDAHLVGDLASGDDQPFVLESMASPAWLVEGFAYQAASSLLGAAITPVAAITRGASLNMDRLTISGGYTPVATPSFVGWA